MESSKARDTLRFYVMDVLYFSWPLSTFEKNLRKIRCSSRGWQLWSQRTTFTESHPVARVRHDTQIIFILKYSITISMTPKCNNQMKTFKISPYLFALFSLSSFYKKIEIFIRHPLAKKFYSNRHLYWHIIYWLNLFSFNYPPI